MLLPSLAFGVAWGALLFVSPDWGAGLFIWSVMWPWLEVHTYLADRSIRRGGIAAWPRCRPLREAALYGGGVAVLVAGVEVASDARLLAALGNALACGAIVGAFTYVIGRREVRVRDESDLRRELQRQGGSQPVGYELDREPERGACRERSEDRPAQTEDHHSRGEPDRQCARS